MFKFSSFLRAFMKKLLGEAFFQKRLGQSSIEYIILIGLILAALIPLIYYTTERSSNDIRINQADQSVQTVANAADNVYTAGPGNREYIQIVLPSGVQSFTVKDRDIIMNISIYAGVSNIHARTIANVVNTTPLPRDQGTYNLIVKMTDQRVEVSK